ncbi:MAG: hypothetical protein L0220_02790 [Acidobacteria bacterium]|nr:hypothetical protein [Acidobacteriota bacterium]
MVALNPSAWPELHQVVDEMLAFYSAQPAGFGRRGPALGFPQSPPLMEPEHQSPSGSYSKDEGG